MEFPVLNFLSTMERIFYGVWKQSSMGFHVLKIVSIMETIFYGVFYSKYIR